MGRRASSRVFAQRVGGGIALLALILFGVRTWRAHAPSTARNAPYFAAVGVSANALAALECEPSDPARLGGFDWIGVREVVLAQLLGPERLCLPPQFDESVPPLVVRLSRLGDVETATRSWVVPDSGAAVAVRDSVLVGRLRGGNAREALCRASSALELAAVVEPTLSTVVHFAPHSVLRGGVLVPAGYRVEVTAMRRGIFACPETLRGKRHRRSGDGALQQA